MPRHCQARIGRAAPRVADQRVLAIELRRRLLKQFSEMKQVGEHSLATSGASCTAAAAQEAEIVHQAAQHRQHALFAPNLAIGAGTASPVPPRRARRG